MSGARPKKSFGQHFLADVRVAARIAELATTPAGGTVVEIGPGQGALTKHLLTRARHVIAIERDRDLVPVLHDGFAAEFASARLRLIEADAKTTDWLEPFRAAPRPHVVAGNVPYNITGPLLERATTIARGVDRVVFLIQKEVADRLVAPAGGDAYGALSVFVQAQFRVERAFVVRPGAFRPPPTVDSAVVVLVPHETPRVEETSAFRELVKRAFGVRRKTLRNAWKGIFGWTREELEARAKEAAIDLDARGETLDVEAFARIARQ